MEAVVAKAEGLPEARRGGVGWWLRTITRVVPSELVSILAAIGAAYSVYPPTKEGPWTAFGFLSGVAVITFLLSAYKCYQAFLEHRHSISHPWEHGVFSALKVMQKAVSQRSAVVLGTEEVRIAAYRVVPPIKNPGQVEQLIDTLGGAIGTAGRRFPVGQGITGRAIRTGDLMRLHRPAGETSESYVNMLKAEYGYTAQEANEVSKDRRSMLAVPITGSGGDTVAVLYLDSVKCDVFDADVVDCVLACTQGVRAYLSERLNV